MTPSILLTGSKGQLGTALRDLLAEDSPLVAVDSDRCDFANPAALRTLIRDVRPRWIINPAAYTAVDKAETDESLAYAINAEALRVIGEEAARIGAWVIHFSTDYVFDGKLERPYQEIDETCPLNVYGRTKREGERLLAASGARHIILRTSWVVGPHGANFAKSILRLASERSSLNIVADQFGAPTSTRMLSQCVALLLSQLKAEPEAEFPQGIFHLACAGETTWYEYARLVVKEALAAGIPLSLGPDGIHPIASAEYPTPAARPMNSRLDCAKFRNAFGYPLPNWEDEVRWVLRKIFDMRPINGT